MNRQYLWYVIINAAIDEVCDAAQACRESGEGPSEAFDQIAANLMSDVVKRRRVESN